MTGGYSDRPCLRFNYKLQCGQIHLVLLHVIVFFLWFNWYSSFLLFFISVFLSEWSPYIGNIKPNWLSYFSKALVYHQPVDLERVVKLHHSVFRCSSAVKSLGPSCGLSHKTHLTHPSHPFPLNAPERKLRFSTESIQLPESVVINLIIVYVFFEWSCWFWVSTSEATNSFCQ